MPRYKGQKLTDKGHALLAKVIAGATLEFTRVALGDGAADPADWGRLTALANPVHSMAIQSKEIVDSRRVSLSARLYSTDLSDGFTLREMGIFAIDPDEGEILYSYENLGEDAETIPQSGDYTMLIRKYSIMIEVGNAANVAIYYTDPDNVTEIAAGVARSVATEVLTASLADVARDILASGVVTIDQRNESFEALEGQTVFVPNVVSPGGVLLVFVNGVRSSSWTVSAGDIVLDNPVAAGMIVEAWQPFLRTNAAP